MLTKEQIEELMTEIKAKAENYGGGRSLVLSFKPLTIDDVVEAYTIGAEELLHLILEGD